ncbi:MAG: Serine phosphatase RsbU, regulator of sigma subunit [uncultured Corynebacteriales bacterium]|uniref:Serine phosphatase RsbU, regulator of sigma subunit n=1 Tax=uncultured Mycobacteriales bacterium TaxID=581187 RepID=A0A6J4HTV5_9ACTN|nr:MAG: Serine phosphatase RsbU, regulator of sigma subunit [uncultured Corynebacteriales bacterium]
MVSAVEAEGARRAAEEQVSSLHAATAGLAAAATVPEVGRIVVDLALPVLGAVAGGLAVLSADGERLEAVHQAGDLPADVLDAYASFAVGDVGNPVATAFRERRPVWITSAGDWDAGFAAGEALRRYAAGALCVPLLLGERVTGVLGFIFPVPRLPGDAAERVAESFAAQAALALERTRLQDQERAALADARRLAGELASSRARLEHLVRSSPAVIYCLDARPPFRLTFVSENVRRIHGVSAADLLADPEPFGGRLHPDDAATVAADFRRLLRDGHTVSEYRLRRPDGGWGWTRDEQVVLLDTDGRPVEIVGSLLDITDRKGTEERAEQLQQLTQGLAAALTPEQVAAGALLPTLSVLEAAGAALILRDPDTHPPTMTVAGHAGYSGEDVRPWLHVPLDSSTPAGDAILAGAPRYLGSPEEARDRFPRLLTGPDQRTRAWAALPLRAGREVVGALAVGFDGVREFPAAERRFLETVAAQCALALERARLYGSAAAERERLAAVLSRLPVGVIIAEAPSGRLVLGNAEVERIWRHPFLAAAEVGEYAAYHGFHPGTDRPYTPTDWPIARSLTRGEVVTGEEVDFQRGDGTRGTMMVNSAPILGPAGSVVAAVCTFLDVTDRAEAGRRLDAAYVAEQRARAAAEAATERLGRLQQVTAGLAEALTVEQVAAVMVRGGMSVAGCRSAWIGVLDDSGRNLVALAASYPLRTGVSADRIPLDAASPRAEVTRTGQPVWLPSTAEALERYPGLRSIGMTDGALGVVPLVSHGRPVGAMMLGFPDQRSFDADERALITTLAEQCAQALERAGLHQRAYDVALTLQQSMLPSTLPEVAGLGLAARYRSAVDSLEVGGDWYDVLALPDGRVALAVGDVVGRGLGAATTMGQLRSALAALALSADSPARVLDGLERFARQVEGARLATVAFGVLDPVAGTLRYACAGHPPPLVLRAGGGTEFLEAGRSALLCALPPGPVGQRPEGTARLRPGDRLLLFSDGLVERRRESLDVGLRRLAGHAATVAADHTLDWPDELVHRMLDGAGGDDVALLAATYEPVLRERLPALPERLSGLRRRLRGWLAGIGATDDEVTDVLLASGEAAANVVEHAYPGVPGELVVELRLTAGRELTVRIADTGQWRQVPAPGDRGRGLPLMRAVMESVDVEREEAGTVVTLRRRLAEPA